MKKTLMALGMVSLLAACSSTPPAPTMAECTYPDAPDAAAPLWVCSAPVEGVEVSAVGSARIGGAGQAFAKQQAATLARVELAQMVSVRVDNMIKQFVETTGDVDSETVDQVLTSVTKQITSETLSGTRVFRTQASPNNYLYVLVGLDESGALAVTESVIRTSMNNERALWQKFQSSKAQDELAAEIARMNAR